MEDALKATADPAWILDGGGCDPIRESSYESRFASSNGFLGVRGARAVNRIARRDVSYPTYVAGLFDTVAADRLTPELVPAADWLGIQIFLAGKPLAHHTGELLAHQMTLDVKRGALLTQCRLSNEVSSVRIRTLHLVSLSQRALGLQLVHLEVEEGEAEITLEATFEGVGLGLVLERLEHDLGVWRTKNSGKKLAIAAASSLQIDSENILPTAQGPFKWAWSWTTRPGQAVCFNRIVAMMRADTDGTNSGSSARQELNVARQLGWRGVIADHEANWSNRWQSSDVMVEGDDLAQKALRFAMYHLNSAANPADEKVSIGARALTGSDYLGHVFWDTEIYLLPFYILTWPAAARAMLMYRFHTLAGARDKAAKMGWAGALYAWESADSGAETTPEQVIGPDRQVIEIFTGRQEQHISADVAYAVWQYWQATADEEFLLDAGAEIILETSRFWASRATRDADGSRHIRGIIGPDEYHEHIDDNAFTNVMARWNIRRALDVVTLLRERWPQQWTLLSSRLRLDETELAHWRDVAGTIVTGLNEKSGLFEQFAGFFKLEDIDLAAYVGRSVPMDVVLGRARTQQSQVIKQADVVALLALLPDEFAPQMGAQNFRYYEPRCGHGSSLSRAMHGIAAARLGYSEMALRYFRETADIDLADTHVAITGGVHIGAQGGIWLMAVFGFAGLSLRSDGLSIDPKLPAGWRTLTFSVQWRGRQLKIKISPDTQIVEVFLKGDAMTLFVSGEPTVLPPQQVLTIDIARKHEAA